jgi:hypothetical protein
MNETLPINRGKREFSLQLLKCSTEALSAIDQVGKEIWQESLQFSQHIVPGQQFRHEQLLKIQARRSFGEAQACKLISTLG